MSGTTTNNAWTYPTSTDYVKDGATAIQTLATGIDTSTGKGLIAWQSYAPTLSGGWLNGNGVYNEAVYCQIGKTVHLSVRFTVGSTTTKGSGLQISLPVAAAATYSFGTVRTGVGGTTNFGPLVAYNASTATAYSLLTSTSYAQQATITSTVPGTWATGDAFTLFITYQAA